jgi:hypothetical protein
MNQFEIRKYKTIQKLNQCLHRHYEPSLDRKENYDALDAVTQETLKIKTKLKGGTHGFILHCRDLAAIKPFCFCVVNKSTDPLSVSETLHKLFNVSEIGMQAVREWANKEMGEHLATHPKNDGIKLTEKKLQELTGSHCEEIKCE